MCESGGGGESEEIERERGCEIEREIERGERERMRERGEKERGKENKKTNVVFFYE